jgi:hypothetical protein
MAKLNFTLLDYIKMVAVVTYMKAKVVLYASLRCQAIN